VNPIRSADHYADAMTRIAELERKLLLARKGLFWIQVRAACDAGEPLADKIVAVATDHLNETADAALPS